MKTPEMGCLLCVSSHTKIHIPALYIYYYSIMVIYEKHNTSLAFAKNPPDIQK